MKKFRFLLILAVAILAFSSCTSLSRSMREPNVRFELNADDMVLSEPVTGTATIIRVFGIDWKHLFKTKQGTIGVPVVGNIPGFLSSDNSYAVYDLLEKNPGWDFLMYPQYKTENYRVLGMGLLYSETGVTVTARLGKLKK
jgi:hypothetical protein